MINEEVKVKCRGGGYLNHLKPKFSSCENRMYIAKKSSVIQYSTKTGLPLFEFQDGNGTIVGFDVVDIDSSENLIYCTENGQIGIWRTVTRFKISSKTIKCSDITAFYYLPKKQEDDIIGEGIITYNAAHSVGIALVNISKGKFKNLNIHFKERNIIISVSKSGYLAAVDNKKIYFYAVNDPEKSKTFLLKHKIHKKTNIKCIECHSTQEIVISGDSEGKVMIWYNIFGNDPAISSYHWHTLPVKCVSFSSLGSYFYSGGNENVLVRWDWENSQNKKFMPRMSASIEQIGLSEKSQLVAVLTSDNIVRILDSAFSDVSSIQHLVIGDNYSCGIKLDPRTKALILNGNVGQIQFYQPNKNMLLYSIDIVGQNQLTNERNLSIDNTRVTKFNISKSSTWLATYEERKDQEMRLKFWYFNASYQTFELNTSMEKPHEGSISSLEFQFSNNDKTLKCVSIGTDKKFKVWHKTVIQHVNIDKVVWSCLSVGFYRDLPCRGLSFSADGSLMGIGFGPILTTWKPDTCELKCSLVYFEYKEDIQQIQFGTNDQCHLIVSTTKNRLSVWNLLSLTIIWTVPLEVDFLLADKISVFMVALTKNKEIFVFTPNSSNPVYSSSDAISSKNIMAAAVIPTQFCLDNQSNWYKRIEILFVNENKELFSIGSNNIDEDIYEEDINNVFIDKLSIYDKMTPHKKISNASVEQRTHLFRNNATVKNVQNYLDAPIHTLPPIRFLCASLMKSRLLVKNVKNTTNNN